MTDSDAGQAQTFTNINVLGHARPLHRTYSQRVTIVIRRVDLRKSRGHKEIVGQHKSQYIFYDLPLQGMSPQRLQAVRTTLGWKQLPADQSGVACSKEKHTTPYTSI
jgi:hypothetical protein